MAAVPTTPVPAGPVPAGPLPAGSGAAAGTASRGTAPSGAEPPPRRGLRGAVARRPVLSFLATAFGLAGAFLVPPALLGVSDLRPFVLLTAVVGLFGGAVAVTAAEGGRPAVRAFLARTFRWRAAPGWYLLAGFGIPAAAVAGATAALGLEPLRSVAASPSAVLALAAGLLAVPLVNLWEEAGWMGFLQARLQDRHGPLRAALLTAPAFALVHLPLQLGQPLPDLALGMVVITVLAVPHRIVAGWLYAATGGSVPVVAVYHAAFNTAMASVLLAGLLPGVPVWGLVGAVVGVAAAAVVAVGRRPTGAAA